MRVSYDSRGLRYRVYVMRLWCRDRKVSTACFFSWPREVSQCQLFMVVPLVSKWVTWA